MKHQARPVRLLSALAAVALLALAGCGDDADSDDARDVPADAVARVGDTVIMKADARTFLPPSVADVPVQRVYQSMILAEWLERDAKREGVDVPAGSAGALLVPILLQSLTQREQQGPVTEQEIARYYREHPREYARPETRYMRSVATDSRASALAARRALERGETWRTVIERYSTRGDANPPSGNMGAQPGEMPDALGDALYAAERGTFNGPAQTDQAWYVFELTSVDRGAPQRLAQVRDALRSRLESRRQTQAIQTVQQRLEARYRPITACNERLRLPPCSNASSADRRSMWTQ